MGAMECRFCSSHAFMCAAGSAEHWCLQGAARHILVGGRKLSSAPLHPALPAALPQNELDSANNALQRQLNTAAAETVDLTTAKVCALLRCLAWTVGPCRLPPSSCRAFCKPCWRGQSTAFSVPAACSACGSCCLGAPPTPVRLPACSSAGQGGGGAGGGQGRRGARAGGICGAHWHGAPCGLLSHCAPALCMRVGRSQRHARCRSDVHAHAGASI